MGVHRSQKHASTYVMGTKCRIGSFAAAGSQIVASSAAAAWQCVGEKLLAAKEVLQRVVTEGNC